MVEVAMAYDFPNKLMMPPIWNPDSSCSMLGLGDILVPGLYLGFLNKFDEKQNTRSYLNSALVAYAASLLVCVVVLIVFDNALPALLYIVPALFLATYANAKYRGELELLRKTEFKTTSEGDSSHTEDA